MRAPRRLGLVCGILALAGLGFGCGDDDSGTNPSGAGQGLVGTWTAQSFVAGGMDALAGGVVFSITFTSGGTYSTSATNDTNGFFCGSSTSCTDGGSYGATASTVTFDPGTVDEESLAYTVSGNTVTLSGTLDGTSVSATFQKT